VGAIQRTAMCCALVVGLAFELQSAAPAQARLARGTMPVVVTIPLAALYDVRALDQRSEIAEVIRTARYFSDSPIFLAAYVTADDAREQMDATGVSVADQLVIEIGGYLASRGVDADRISGKGMGIDSTIGRAVVVSFGLAPATPDSGFGVRHAVDFHPFGH